MSSSFFISADQQDILGHDYRARTLSLPCDAVSTLIHYTPKKNQSQTTFKPKGSKAILYIHGYTDYFFQTEMAEYFYQLGYHFYAIDLQGYGRSARPNSSPIHFNSFADYHHDLSAAFDVMQSDGMTECIPLAHSMGTLVLNNYLRHYADKHNPNHESDHSSQGAITIKGIILNSPFLALPLSAKQENYILPIYRFVAKYFSFITLDSPHINNYARSLHSSLSGEWSYRLDWKPASGFPLSFAWVKQVLIEQALSLQNPIPIPTLLCRSHISTYSQKEMSAIRMGDGVLDVNNIEAKAKTIYPNLSVSIIENGFHDLSLSPKPIRNNYMDSMKHWLQKTQD